MTWTPDDFVGGHPALDFINTVTDEHKSRLETRLLSWSDVLEWSEWVDISVDLGAFPVASPETMAELHEFREASYRFLSATAGDRAPDAADTAHLQQALQSALSRAVLCEIRSEPVWAVAQDSPSMHLDFFALLTESFMRTGAVDRLRECGRCTWLFVDRGRGRRRRWCEMKKCGNRTKAEKYRKRQSERKVS